MFGPAMSSLFKASVFQMFEQDTEGCICARHFLTYLSLRSAMVQMVGTPWGSQWLPALAQGKLWLSESGRVGGCLAAATRNLFMMEGLCITASFPFSRLPLPTLHNGLADGP